MRLVYSSLIALLLGLLFVLSQGSNAPAAPLRHVSAAAGAAAATTPDTTYVRKLPPGYPGVTPAATSPKYLPETCDLPVVNSSRRSGNEAETYAVVNPTNPNNIVTFSNLDTEASIFKGYSFDGGATWTHGTVATGAACCDGQATFDQFGNLWLVYINGNVNMVNLLLSTDGGVTFGTPTTVGAGSIDQPSIAVGNGSVWVDWNLSGNMMARGAPVTGLGTWGPFGNQQSIPSAGGSFGGITVGPGPNGGAVMVTYQNPTGGEGPATIYVNVDADGLGSGGFGPRITVTNTNVGGFDYIPAQSGRSIDAEAGLVWDATGGPYNGRVYLVYTEEVVNESNDTDIEVRTSTDSGATWTAPVRVNDDPPSPIRSQFLPYISMDRTTGTVAIGWLDCRNDNGVPGSGGTNTIPNDDAQYYASYSTNGGVTWAPNVRLSSAFSNAADAGSGVDYGDYLGQDAHAGKFVAGWSDNANCDGTNANGTLHQLDLYVNTLPLPAVGTPTPTVTGTPPTSSPTRTSTLTPSPTPTACGDLIVNGGFETGSFAPWQILGTQPAPTVRTGTAHTGTHAAFLGSDPGTEPTGDSAIYQQITVPASGGTLSYWYYPYSEDSITFDWQDAYVTDTSGTILATIMHVCETTQTWTQVTYNMSAYAGQTVRIEFLVHQDGFGDVTNMYVDDVSLPGGPCGTPTITPTPGCNSNYTYATGTATIVPGTSFVAGSSCNSCAVPLTLPFAYALYGTAYTSAMVSNKGVLEFTGSSSSGANECLPTALLTDSIMPYWDDLNTFVADTMGVYTSVSGSAPNRVFNIEWRSGIIAADVQPHFEVRLYEGQQRFDFVYGQTRGGGYSTTIGVQHGSGAGGAFTQFACNQSNVVPSGRLITFTRTCLTR